MITAVSLTTLIQVIGHGIAVIPEIEGDLIGKTGILEGVRVETDITEGGEMSRMIEGDSQIDVLLHVIKGKMKALIISRDNRKRQKNSSPRDTYKRNSPIRNDRRDNRRNDRRDGRRNPRGYSPKRELQVNQDRKHSPKRYGRERDDLDLKRQSSKRSDHYRPRDNSPRKEEDKNYNERSSHRSSDRNNSYRDEHHRHGDNRRDAKQKSSREKLDFHKNEDKNTKTDKINKDIVNERSHSKGEKKHDPDPVSFESDSGGTKIHTDKPHKIEVIEKPKSNEKLTLNIDSEPEDSSAPKQKVSILDRIIKHK